MDENPDNPSLRHDRHPLLRFHAFSPESRMPIGIPCLPEPQYEVPGGVRITIVDRPTAVQHGPGGQLKSFMVMFGGIPTGRKDDSKVEVITPTGFLAEGFVVETGVFSDEFAKKWGIGYNKTVSRRLMLHNMFEARSASSRNRKGTVASGHDGIAMVEGLMASGEFVTGLLVGDSGDDALTLGRTSTGRGGEVFDGELFEVIVGWEGPAGKSDPIAVPIVMGRITVRTRDWVEREMATADREHLNRDEGAPWFPLVSRIYREFHPDMLAAQKRLEGDRKSWIRQYSESAKRGKSLSAEFPDASTVVWTEQRYERELLSRANELASREWYVDAGDGLSMDLGDPGRAS